MSEPYCIWNDERRIRLIRSYGNVRMAWFVALGFFQILALFHSSLWIAILLYLSAVASCKRVVDIFDERIDFDAAVKSGRETEEKFKNRKP